MTTWRVSGGALSLARPLVMGIVNTTPDSFSDGGRHLSKSDAIAHGREMAASGADIVDVGGESTRPGAASVDLDEELRRTIPVIEALAAENVIVSIDTRKPAVADRALRAGARIVNDVGGLGDPAMCAVVAECGAGAVLMHMLGTPETMQDDPRYRDVISEISDFLVDRAEAAIDAGVDPACLVIDPGIGFGKTLEHNLVLMNRLGEFVELGYPVMVGASRKRFLGTLTGRALPEDRDLGSAVAMALAIERGASVVRVHDVAKAVEAARVTWAIVREEGARWAPIGVEGAGR